MILEFSGISRCAHFYVNGQDLAQQVVTLPGSSASGTPAEKIEVGYHENGIGPCGLDITNYLNPAGQDNLIAVWSPTTSITSRRNSARRCPTASPST